MVCLVFYGCGEPSGMGTSLSASSLGLFWQFGILPFCVLIFYSHTIDAGDCGGTVVKVLCYKLEGRWFDPSWCQLIFH